MTPLQEACEQYLSELKRIAEEAVVHFELNSQETAQSDVQKAAKMMTMSLICKEITSISQQLHIQ